MGFLNEMMIVRAHVCSLLVVCTVQLAESSCVLPTFAAGVVASPLYESYEAEEQVVFACSNNTLQLVGSNSSACTSGGSWTSPSPLCVGEDVCGEPPSLAPHISTTVCQHSGCVSYYSCFGRSETITCLEEGNWSSFTGACAEVWCPPPPIVNNVTAYSTDNGPIDGWYSVSTRASYNCDTGQLAVGDAEIVCLDNGAWTETAFLCQDFPDSTSNPPPSLSNTTVIPVPCSTPNNSPSPHLRVRRQGGVLSYWCDAGYLLMEGDAVRRCLINGTWTGVAPVCAAPFPIVPAGPSQPVSQFRWEQVFVTYDDWVGRYVYLDRDVAFHFKVQSIQLDSQEGVTGLLAGDDVQIEIRGIQDPSGGIKLSIIRMVTETSEHFPTTNWYVLGHLVEKECTWSYVGQIHADVHGFSGFTMFTTRSDADNDPRCAGGRNMTLVVVSISLACLLISALAIIAIICVRRTGIVRSSGHRSLTSFENPIYEYEHGIQTQ